jgi:8-oxo-dGTP diphosphatase
MTTVKRRRGTAIVETPKGILVVSRNNKTYNLPGGGAEIGENQKQATIRELKEETNLEAKHVEFLFNFEALFNNHQVYLVEPQGKAKPSHEIKYLEYYNGSNLKISNAAQEILEQYQYTRPRKMKK